MKILMTNDDGIHGIGLILLARALSKKHEVVVAAPDRERSASSCGLTLHTPIHYQKAELADYEGIEAYSITGMPADCAKFALSMLVPDAELVVSGINIGGNLGTDINYSGTVGAALEACMAGYAAIAFSQHLKWPTEQQEIRKMLADSAEVAAEMVDDLDSSVLQGYIYNVNFPPVKREEVRGIKACQQGKLRYEGGYRMESDSFGRTHYWMAGKPVRQEYNETYQTDIKWIDEGYITISPLTWNLTAQSAMQDAECNISKINCAFPRL
ncbi:MAG: 5'/3'-nucleotidase SurE [Christensenellaceae bacterium]